MSRIFKPCSISFPPKLLELVDKKAEKLNLSRSAYICDLIVKDLDYETFSRVLTQTKQTSTPIETKE